MKTYQLIFLSTFLFVLLFYGEDLGLNLGILGIVYASLLLFTTSESNKTKIFYILFATSIVSSLAFAYYGDFSSFLAIVSSVFLLSFKAKDRHLKTLFIMPVFAINFIIFIYRFFKFDEWLMMRNTAGTFQNIIAVFLIPTFLTIAFFAIYASGSDHFSQLFAGFQLNFNFWEFFILACLGFFIAFNIWNFRIEKFFNKLNENLRNNFIEEHISDKSTYTFMSLQAERRSGVVSFFALNILLLIFIITFNYEQFVQISKTPSQLSAETHERVNAVIFSIVMAIMVILFYFKGTFNFDENAKYLKIAAKIWLVLNAVLVFSAMAKNVEYTVNLGLTYKRLGVFCFLTLSLIGLLTTFIKIQKKKTNAFLFNQMIWFFYATILVCSFFNWGNIATLYNIKNNKGNYEFLHSLHYNHKALQKYFPNEFSGTFNENKRHNDNQYFLSKVLYYETF